MNSSENQAKILIVDDMPKNIQVLGSILMQENYNISFANSGQDALEIAKNNPIDLILLDVMMPGIDGFETCIRLQADEKTKDIPVIFMTALSETSDKVKGFAAGAVDYITKPYEAEEVLSRVKTHLSLRLYKSNLEKKIEELEVRNRFIKRTFGRYLSEDIVSKLLASPEGVEVGGKKVTVTILMSDIRGFSAITDKLKPEQVVSMLNSYLSKMTDVIIKYDGTIDEFIGDAIMVIFGAPIWKDDHATRAAACAVDMQLAVNELNEVYRKDGFPEVEIGIGINTGEVVVGNIGSMKRAKYGVVGRNVNVVSRIESYTVGNQILISQATKDHVTSEVVIRKSIRVNPKGVRQPIELYDLRGVKDPYNLLLPEFEDTLQELSGKLTVKYVELDEKAADQVTEVGYITHLSENRACIEIVSEIPLYTNFKISVVDVNEELKNETVYAKAVEEVESKTRSYIIHFTHMPQRLKNYIFNKLVSNS